VNAGLLAARGNVRARGGRWKEAVQDFSKVIELDPSFNYCYFTLAALLVQTGDQESYRRHCERIHLHFDSLTNDAYVAFQMAKAKSFDEQLGRVNDNDNDAYVAFQMAKACLILPPVAPGLETESRWAEVAVTSCKLDWLVPYVQFCKGLAEFRQGHFSEAKEWTRRTLERAGIPGKLRLCATMVQAMALDQLTKVDEARAALAEGVQFAETKMPKSGSGDLGEDWIDWIIAHALLREAKALIERNDGESGGTKASESAPQQKYGP
jgi:serine/threonine-protein kinase